MMECTTRSRKATSPMAAVLLTVLEIYTIILIARSLFSWFRPDPRTALGQINEVLIKLTEPVLGPVRRVLPRTGMIDLSVLAVILLINIVLVPIVSRL